MSDLSVKKCDSRMLIIFLDCIVGNGYMFLVVGACRLVLCLGWWDEGLWFLVVGWLADWLTLEYVVSFYRPVVLMHYVGPG